MSITIYKASAGSGKTFTLTQKYLELLLERDSDYFRHVLVATFTNKATKELRDRVLRELYNAIKSPGSGMTSGLLEKLGITKEELKKRARNALKAILGDYDFFRVQTIDSFFHEVIHSFVLELSETKSRATAEVEMDVDKPISISLDRVFTNLGSSAKLFRWVERIYEEQADDESQYDVRGATLRVAKQFIFGDLSMGEDDLPEVERYKKSLLNFRDSVRAKAGSQYTAAIQQVEKVVVKYGLDVSISAYSGFLQKILNSTFDDAFGTLLDGKSVVHGTLRKSLLEGKNVSFASSKEKSSLEGKKYIPASDELAEVVLNFLATEDTLRNDAWLLYTVDNIVLKYIDLLPILVRLKKELEDYLEENRVLLISEVNDLVQEVVQEDDIPFMYEKVGARINHYMIDEFQDTSAVQWKNFKPLVDEASATGGSSYIVGDLKQSIYRWRGAQSEIMNSVMRETSHPDDIKTLDTNYRSLRGIVDFNNYFFSNIYDYQSFYDGMFENITESESVYTEDAENSHNVKQKVRGGVHEEGGYVRLEMLQKEKSKEAEDEVLLGTLAPLVKELQEEYGYKRGDIAFLVRKNDEATRIADILITAQKNAVAEGRSEEASLYDFTSSEALEVNNSTVVQLITTLFQFFSHRGDDFYLRQLEIIADDAGAGGQLETLKSFISGGESIYDVALKVIKVIKKIPEEELVYVNSFLDILHSYAARGICTYAQFSLWWEENKHDLKVEMGEEEQDSITIITIHSAKGLEFPVVIMPYASWPISPKSNTSISVLATDDEIYKQSGLPETTLPFILIPEEVNNKHLSSAIKERYEQLRESDYMDSLNLLYVAFTRAKEHLYVYGREQGKNATSKTASSIILHKLGEEIATTYECGTRHRKILHEVAEEKELEPEVMKDILTFSRLPDLSLNEEQLKAMQTKKKDFGITLHRLLATVWTPDDFEKALSSTSQLTSEEKAVWLGRFQSALRDSEVATWFDTDGQTILLEQSIAKEEMKESRPDRVVINHALRQAVVIDYKFGVPQEQYHEQVSQYMHLLKSAGFEQVEGYLWYNLSEIEEVKI